MRWRAVGLALTALVCARPTSPTQPTVIVDRETHVSRAEASFKMGETLLVAHPTDPQRLVGAAMSWLTGAGRRAVIVYTSRDGGVSWAKTFSTADTLFDASDEALAFGPDGTVYLVLTGWATRDERANQFMYRSDDGGLTWVPTSRTATSISVDRPFVVVDKDGTVWMATAGIMQRADGSLLLGPAIFTSTDRGHTLSLAGMQPSVAPKHPFANGNIVITSDSVAVSLFSEMDDVGVMLTERIDPGWYQFPERVAGSVLSMRTTPALRLEPQVTVSRAVHPMTSTEGIGPTIAIDPGSRLYKDRLYAVWPDRRSGHSRIMSAFSMDKGLRWSTVRAVDDRVSASAPQQDPNHFLPAVAVNRAGVVGAIWYDRREDPMNLGWRLRFAASTDGGETWSNSSPVASHLDQFNPDGVLSTTVFGAPIQMSLDDRQLNAGDTVGFAASADGSFHAVWIGSRSGIPQVWSARIRVDADATRNGSAELDELADVTPQVRVITEEASYRSGTVQITMTLTNTSNQVMSVPAKLRAIVVESTVGTPELMGADNGEPAAGAVWDLAPYFPDGQLAPHGISKPLRISARLRSRKPFVEGRLLRDGLLHLETKVLATVH